ncbi:MAG: bifunctional DNA-formamidopyrimidine glycosylase/DNA-(apurinic or apyrimidinic site) lyase [Gemmatimonadota bacterium]
MPELPEAETIVRDLRGRVVGRTILSVDVVHPDILAPGTAPDTLADALRRARIAAVERRGKNVVLTLEPERIVVVNLGMTGRLVTSDAPAANRLGHIAVRFELDDGHALLYDDVRRFGRISLHSPASWRERQAASLGVEPLSDDFTGDRLHELTSASRSPIRNWLLDQRRIAGIGNIYANEALYRAGIHPARPAHSLDRHDAARLRAALRAVLREAIDARGTTLRDYRDSRGEVGRFEPRLRVYGREGEPCPDCGGTIERIVIGNRSAFLCPMCQT